MHTLPIWKSDCCITSEPTTSKEGKGKLRLRLSSCKNNLIVIISTEMIIGGVRVANSLYKADLRPGHLQNLDWRGRRRIRNTCSSVIIRVTGAMKTSKDKYSTSFVLLELSIAFTYRITCFYFFSPPIGIGWFLPAGGPVAESGNQEPMSRIP